MGTNTLETAYSNGQIIDASHVNELTAAIINQFVGRNTSGVPESGKSLGTAAIPWGAIHASSLILGGLAVDTSQITSLANRIVTGPTRADSEMPDFLRADGTLATLNVLGATTNITLTVNAAAVTVSTDIAKTSLTLAPSTNNTCLVNDTNMSNDLYAGEYDAEIETITIDTVGSEISALVGQYIALKTATGEILYGFLKSSTEITNVYRGFFFDDTGAPIVRGNLSNNDTLTLMNVGYVFIEDNGTTVDISYDQPVYSYEAPSGPATGQYWFDIPNQVWKRYSGTEFVIINRILVGMVVLDSSAAIATRCADFTNSFGDFNNVELEIYSTEIVKSKELSNKVSVYGTEVIQDLNKLQWNITTDLETGLTEAASTYYYLYLATDGQRIISDERPHYRSDLKGFYHPYHTWRCVGEIFNDGSNNITRVSDFIGSKSIIRLHTGNGRGGSSSGDTAIHNFATTIEYSGTEIEYIPRTTTTADYFKIRKSGYYDIVSDTVSDTLDSFSGISLNTTQTSTAITGLTNKQEKLAAHQQKVNGDIISSSWSGYLRTGDLIRAHISTSGNAVTSNNANFSISKSSK